MRHFNSIIEQSTPPATNSIWLSGTNMKYFTNGAWQTIGESGDINWVDIKGKPSVFYTLPVATATVLGGVKKAATVAALAADADLATTVAKVNAIIAGLKAAGIMA